MNFSIFGLGRGLAFAAFVMSVRKSFYVQNFGCRATQADGAAIATELSARGLARAAARANADVVVVNTCTVTAEADQDARQTIRRVHRENPRAEILVTGCYAQRSPRELSDLDGVKWVVGNSHKTRIGDIVASPFVSIQGAEMPAVAYHGEIAGGGVWVGDIFEQRAFLSAPVLEAGHGRTRPNLKIQDGCHNRCSFCIIPSVRGNSRSAPAERVLREIRSLAPHHAEIVLSGINLGRWGRDLPGRPRFVELLRSVLAETHVKKLRLSSVEPMDWSDDLLRLMAANERIAKHVHMPLQSASDRVLRAMRRRYRARHYADRIQQARRVMPWASLGADVMAGFPGETGEDFEATRRFIAEMPFTYLHVFTYSARPGTPAAELAGQVPMAVRKGRNRILRELIAEKGLAFQRSLIGRRLSAVTLDHVDHSGTLALTDNYLHVMIEGQRVEPGRLLNIQITRVGHSGCRARMAET